MKCDNAKKTRKVTINRGKSQRIINIKINGKNKHVNQATYQKKSICICKK